MKGPVINIVIFGAAGFVGVNLLARLHHHPDLARRYASLVLVDPLQYGEQKIPPAILDDPRIRFVRASTYDPAVADEVFGAGDLVIQLAAQVNSFTAPQAGSVDYPPGYLQRLVGKRIGRLLLLSSADVYGSNPSVDLQETDPVPAVPNTSLNSGWEPIVATPGQALAFFYSSPADALVINNCVVTK